MGRIPGVLIALNHPFWLEEGVEETDHRRALDRVLRECNHLFPRLRAEWDAAMEREPGRCGSRAGMVAAGRFRRRPARVRAAACLNLTNATSFAEFAGEVRSGTA